MVEKLVGHLVGDVVNMISVAFTSPAFSTAQIDRLNLGTKAHFFFSTAKQMYNHGTSRKVCQPLTPPRLPLEVGNVITILECSNGIFRNLALGHPDCPMKVWASGVAAQAPEPLGSGLERKVVKDVCPI